MHERRHAVGRHVVTVHETSIHRSKISRAIGPKWRLMVPLGEPSIGEGAAVCSSILCFFLFLPLIHLVLGQLGTGCLLLAHRSPLLCGCSSAVRPTGMSIPAIALTLDCGARRRCRSFLSLGCLAGCDRPLPGRGGIKRWVFPGLVQLRLRLRLRDASTFAAPGPLACARIEASFCDMLAITPLGVVASPVCGSSSGPGCD